MVITVRTILDHNTKHTDRRINLRRFLSVGKSGDFNAKKGADFIIPRFKCREEKTLNLSRKSFGQGYPATLNSVAAATLGRRLLFFSNCC